MTITCIKETAGMQDEVWHQFGIQNLNGAVLSVYSVLGTFQGWGLIDFSLVWLNGYKKETSK